jgi:hypothetical protein
MAHNIVLGQQCVTSKIPVIALCATGKILVVTPVYHEL